MTEAETLLAIAGILAEPADATEALRRVCRELARFTGAETVSVHVLDETQRVLAPAAAYHVPREALPVLAAEPIPVDAEGFRDSVFAGEPAWSDDVARDPRFVSPLFRRFPHRAGLVLPVREPDRVIGAFYLVWWRTARGFTPAELATLKAIAQQVGLLLRNARLRRESEQRRVAAERAEARYRELVEEVPVGVFRSTPGGEILDVNPALIRLLGFRDREALLAQPVAALYVDPADRERYTAQLAQEGVVREFPVQLRRADGRAVWVQLDTTSVEEDGRTVFCGVIQDITDRQRAEAAERTSQTLRYVASLATAAAHEINNPLAIITARLELLRRRLGDDEDTAAKMDVVLEAGRRISGIIARMGHIERLEMLEGAPREAPMLDLRASAPGDAPPPADR